MRIHLVLAAGLALAAARPAPAQTTPRGVARQARADRPMEQAHAPRRGESLSKEPKLLRQEDHLRHKGAKKRKFKR